MTGLYLDHGNHKSSHHFHLYSTLLVSYQPSSLYSLTRGSRRGKAVIVLAAAAAAAAAAFRYQAAALNQNDIEQRTRKAPHGYVSVDRSGGGI